jgi:hypothetical protein
MTGEAFGSAAKACPNRLESSRIGERLRKVL